MYPAVFAKIYPLASVGETLASAAADGFAGVQFNLSCAGLKSLPNSVPAGLSENVAASASSRALKLAALSGTYNMAHPDPEQRHAFRAGFANVIIAAKAMGAPIVTLCTGSRNAEDMWAHHPDNCSPQAWKDLRVELDFALDLASFAGLRLGIEPEPGNVVSDATVARRLLDEVGDAPLGIVLDAANLLPPEKLRDQQRLLADALHLLGDRVLLAHAKDIDTGGAVVPAGQGAVDLAGFVAHLRAAGYAGALIGHGFSPSAAPGVAKVLRRLTEAV